MILTAHAITDRLFNKQKKAMHQNASERIPSETGAKDEEQSVQLKIKNRSFIYRGRRWCRDEEENASRKEYRGEIRFAARDRRYLEAVGT